MTSFYDRIPPIYNISAITNPLNYHPVPKDWHIAFTDVKGSTKAIEAGLYKEVNAVAAASITALLNAIPDIDLPYVFGGDGATMLIPPDALYSAQRALLGSQQLATEQFELDLRAGVMPVADVYAAGHAITIAKLWMSENFQQAIFSGGGLAYAEKRLKGSSKYDLPADILPEASFEGFECRWNAVPSPYEETVTLIVQAENNAVYEQVIQSITDIYGDSATRHPITVQNMSMALNPVSLSVESRIRHRTRRPGQLLRILMSSLFGAFLMRFNINNWASYKPNFVGATDHEKFDDTLRMTIAGTAHQREKLSDFLESRRQSGELVYGIHTSESALVTCIVFDYFGRQVHLVDGAGGGYALAARQMKGFLAKTEN